MLVPALRDLAIVWSFIMLADLPISIVTYAIGWKYSLLGMIWIVIAGTFWWYALSRGLKLALNTFRNLRAPLT